MSEGTFGTAVNCMDGRVQLPVIDWLKKEYDLDYVDMVTEAGPVGILSGERAGPIEAIRDRVLISNNVHGSRLIAVVAHGDCAGNPVPRDGSIKQLRESMAVISSWNLSATIVGLWVDETDWQVELIATSSFSS